MLSKKPLFNPVFTGKLLAAFLMCLLVALPNTSFSQNTKGDRPGISPGPIREPGRSKSKIKSSRSSGGQLRTANPRKSGRLKNLRDQKTSDATAGERASISPKRVKAPRTASQPGRVAALTVKPYVNSSSYAPPKTDRVDRSGRTASGKRLVTRQPSRSVNIYDWSGPKPKYGAPERPREERPYSGNRTASGKKIINREPSDKSQNLYQGKQQFVSNPSPKPRSSDNITSRPVRALRSISTDRTSSDNPSGVAARSVSKTFVTSPKNNVYWGKFSPQRGQIITDMYGRPLRKKDFQTASNETLPSDTVPGVNRVTRTTTSANKKETANRSATRSGLAWQGDISGKKLRSASADPRRNGPAELQKQGFNIGGLSGKNLQSQSRRSGLASGAGALMKAGGKSYLRNSAKAFGTGAVIGRIQKLGTAGLTKGNMRMSARFSGGLQKKDNGSATMNINKNSGGSYSGKMKPAYGSQSSGGTLKLSGKSNDPLMKNSGVAAKSERGKVYGLSGGLVSGKGKVDPSLVAKAPLKNDRPRKSSSRENAKQSAFQAQAGNYRFKKSLPKRIAPGATEQVHGGRTEFQSGRSKRTIIGSVIVFAKKQGDPFEKVMFKSGKTRTNSLQGFVKAQRSGFQSGNQKGSMTGSFRILKKNNDRLESRQGMYRIKKPGTLGYQSTFPVKRNGFQTASMKPTLAGEGKSLERKTYSIESGKRKVNPYRLNPGDMSRLYAFRKPVNQTFETKRYMASSRSDQKSPRLTMQQRESELRRANVGIYQQLNLSRYSAGVYFNLGASSPLTRKRVVQTEPFQIKNRIAVRKPEDVNGLGKQRILAARSNPALPSGYVVKIKSGANKNRINIDKISPDVPVMAINRNKVDGRMEYRLPGSPSVNGWNSQLLNYRVGKVDEKQLSNTEGLKGTLLQDRYVRNPASSIAALKVREPDQAFIRMGLIQANVRMKKSEAPSFHPDSKFAQLKEDNAEGEKSFKTSIRLVFAKAFGRNDLQPSNVKDKMRRPRYDPREIKIWYD